MTEQTAKQVFDMLVSEIRSKGFTDIGTFLIPQVNSENQFAEFSNDYKYIDTETALEEIIMRSNALRGSIRALRELVNASLNYFTTAYEIPDSFSKSLNELDKEKQDHDIYMTTTNEQTIRLDTMIKTKPVSDLIRLLNGIQENMELDDDTFFNRIANL